MTFPSILFHRTLCSWPRLTSVVLSGLAGTAMAQAVPDAGVLLQQQQNLERRIQTSPDASVIVGPSSAEAPARREGEVTVWVKAFRLSGSFKAFTEAELLAVLKPYVGRTLTVNQLQDAAQSLTTFYREHGYFLARAYLVKQDVTEGTITLEVREGALDTPNGVRVQGWDLRMAPAQLQALVQQALAAEPALRLQQLERGVLLINDLPGMAASADLEAGKAPGTTRVVIEAKEGPLASGSLMLDNYGNRYVGSQRLTGGLTLNDLRGLGEQFNLGLASAVNGTYHYGSLGYSLPVGYNGLRVGATLSDLHFGIGQELSSQNSKGTARSYGLNARYPLQRTRAQSVYASASYEARALYNETSGTATSDKRLNLVNLGLSLERSDALWGGGTTLASGTLTAGSADLGLDAANLAQDQSASGPRTQGHYTKLGWSLTRLQQASGATTVNLLMAGQFAGKNLDSSEKFQVGGPTGVRAYPTGEAIGDQGLRATLETRQRLGQQTRLGEASWGVFYDWGRIQQYRNSADLGLTKPNIYAIAGYGVSLSLSKANDHDVRLMWAHKVGSNPNQANGKDSDGTNDRSRVWLMLTQSL